MADKKDEKDIFDKPIRDKRNKKIQEFILWVIPVLLLVIATSLWTKDTTNIPSVALLCGAVYWLGINTDRYFRG
jgi:hypothetical protein